MNSEVRPIIRQERSGDRSYIRKVNETAFGRPDEADLIDGLHTEGALLLSLVAEFDEIIGHILFSRMTVETEHGSLEAVSLAPMSVHPDYQRRGIGGLLIRTGLAELRKRGERIVIVLGHKDYYHRFGFTAENARYLVSPFPPENFMAMELSEGVLAEVQGTVKYAAAFGL
jgi:putative acetyltransferase